jgi:hypothetical protein
MLCIYYIINNLKIITMKKVESNQTENNRLTLEEFQREKLQLNLADYLTGESAAPMQCSDCLPCENYCHDAE